MNEASGVPFVSSVLYPTDFAEGSEDAFAHALAIALLRRSALTLIHAGRPRESDWSKFPPVRRTLERWGLLEKGSPRSAVFDQLWVNVKKVAVKGPSALGAILDYLGEHPADLIVLATEGREGLPRWVRPSVAERLARRSHALTLFVPKGARGFVAPADGSLSLRRVLIPVDHSPRADEVLVRVERAAAGMSDPTVEVVLLHVGEAAQRPPLALPADAACRFRWESRSGPVVDAILAAAREHDVDLIAMATAGHDGVLDALRGSVTEQVMRGAPCPLLAVPAS